FIPIRKLYFRNIFTCQSYWITCFNEAFHLLIETFSFRSIRQLHCNFPLQHFILSIHWRETIGDNTPYLLQAIVVCFIFIRDANGDSFLFAPLLIFFRKLLDKLIANFYPSTFFLFNIPNKEKYR